MAVAGGDGDVVGHGDVELEARRAREQALHARRDVLDPVEPERGPGRKRARRPPFAERRRGPQPRGARRAVEVARDDRPQASPRRQHERPRRQRRRGTEHADQRQAGEQRGERELALDLVGDPLLGAVEDEVARPLDGRRHVVAERSPRVSKLDEVPPGAGERLPAREAHRLSNHVPERRRRERQQHDRLARPRPAARGDDAQAGLQIVEALLGREHPQERHQPVDGREPSAQLLAPDDAARVDPQAREIEAHLPEHDPLEHPASLTPSRPVSI